MARAIEESVLDFILVKNTRNGQNGGFKMTLVDRELTTLEKDIIVCSACTGILREPVLIGNNFKCKSCLEPDEDGRASELQDKITKNLQINCPFMKEGCVWKGSIANIIDHKRHCQYFLLKFPNCPESVTECSFKRYGCEVVTKRKYMENHEQDCQTKHLKLMDKHIKNTDNTLQKVSSELGTLKAQFQDLNQQLKQTENDMKCTFGGIIFELPGIKDKMKTNQNYKTMEFYVGLYKFQGTIYLNHNNDKNLGIFIQIVKGKFDEDIIWPFSGDISITLLNKVNEHNSISSTFTTKGESAFKKFCHDSKPIGINKLATHDTISRNEYSGGDSIKIKILIQFDAQQCVYESRINRYY
ncbi:TNF receptor-associated factor 4-like [Oopsacas minuta]|uniref:TNF receptor-associated factor 4-like n=1 Tax=Oopsacas minuta TaxID=111878 RepID=A0AAV7K0A3_9METZ|nr:TNF receptor-associated factor 4-like [Oopsacas minuta]